MSAEGARARKPDRKTCCLCGFEGVRSLEEEGGPPILLHISCSRCADYIISEEATKHLTMIRKREGPGERRFPDLVGSLHLVSGHTRELRLLGAGRARLTEEGAVAVVRAALTTAGWERVRDLRHRPPTAARHLAFVALAEVDASSRLLDEGIRPAVESSGFGTFRSARPGGPGGSTPRPLPGSGKPVSWWPMEAGTTHGSKPRRDSPGASGSRCSGPASRRTRATSGSSFFPET